MADITCLKCKKAFSALDGTRLELCLECWNSRTPEDEEKARKMKATDALKVSSVGHKPSEGKPMYELLPPDALDEIVKALTYGAEKHGPRDWEKGVHWSKYWAAAMRHLLKWWWKPDERDEGSKLSHLAHAGACIFFLLAYEERGMGEKYDDRPGGEKEVE